MPVSAQPHIIRNTGEITSDTRFGNNQEPIAGALKHLALALPAFSGVALDFYPCVCVREIEVRNVNGIGR